MGKMTEYALYQAADMGRYMSEATAFAFAIERALESAGVVIPEGAGTYLAKPLFVVWLNTPELQTDRTLMTAIRRALSVPSMVRTFSKESGTFTFEGKSRRSFSVEGEPLTLQIRAGTAGCKITRYTVTREVAEYQAECDPSTEELTDG